LILYGRRYPVASKYGTMPKSGKKQNCLYCDSARHTVSRCPLTFGNKLSGLYSVECPDFHSYTLKELKVIALINPFKYNFDSRPAHFENRKNKEHGYDPIPLTLSKNRLIQALTNRWKGRKTIIQQYNTPPDEEECPVCYNPIQYSSWHYAQSCWETDYWQGTIRTKCNHHFCGSCWNKIKPIRNRYNEPDTKTCPMCRQENTEMDIVHRSGITA